MDRRDVSHSRCHPQWISGWRDAGAVCNPGGAPAAVSEGLRFMLHITCDLCGKELRGGGDHYVVKIEVFPTQDPAVLTEADLDEDHMEAVSQMLREMEDMEAPEVEPPSQQRRYDLCPECRKRYLRDPLNREAAQKFDFS